jgi:hypothetical protein
MFQRRVCVNYALRNSREKKKKRIMSFQGAYLVYVSKNTPQRLRKWTFERKTVKTFENAGEQNFVPTKKTKSGKIAVIDLKIPSKKNRENFLLRKKFFRWKKLAFLCEFSLFFNLVIFSKNVLIWKNRIMLNEKLFIF